MSVTIRIKEKTISRDGPIYVIAEMACAHGGDMEKAKRLVDAAVNAKADAVQLQFFSGKDLMTPDHEVYKLLCKLEFSPEQWGEIYEHARKSPIHVFACTYDMPSAKLAIELGVDGIKVNSSDLSNPDLLKILARSGIPFTLGTGASTVEEIAGAVNTSLQHSGDKIVIMHGMQNFPTRLKNAHIKKIGMLGSLFPFPVGYQDHTDASDPFSRVVDLLAVGAGACVIEKHLTLDRSERGIDYQAALEPREFEEFVRTIRTAECAMGPNRILPLSEDEREYREFQKKSIVAIRSMKPGEIIKREDIAFMRTPKMGLQPTRANQVLGKTLIHALARHETLLLKYLKE